MENDQIFEFGPFVLDPLAQTLFRDGQEISLPPKAFAVLSMLVRNAGRVVTKDEIFKEVWPDVIVEDQNVSLNIYLARRAVGDDADNPTYIATVARRGYRFVAAVVKKNLAASLPLAEVVPSAAHSQVLASPTQSTGEANSPEHEPESELVGKSAIWLGSLKLAFVEDGWFLLTSCTLYALLYAIALFVEVAYQFSSHAASAVRVAPVVFLWIWITSMAGLIACRVLTSTERAYSLPLVIVLFIASGVVVYVFVGSILPNVPITKALFRTYPAHGAYFKSISHFFPLAVIFLVVPYHFVVAARIQIRSGSTFQIRELLSNERFGTAPKGAVFLRVKWLAVMLMIAAIGSIVATAHLMDNLISTEYTNLFTQLIQWRMVLYFSLGVICLMWYSRSLNTIKISSLQMDR